MKSRGKHRARKRPGERVAGALKLLAFLVLIALLWPARYGGIFQVTMVNGTSMNPTYYTGDLVLSVNRVPYEVGDVVVYHTKDLECSRCNVVHRLVGGTPEAWTTKGDNNPNTDPWHPSDSEVLGKVVFFVKARGWSHFILAPGLWITFLLFVGGAATLWYFWEYFLKEEEVDQEPDEAPKRDREKVRS